MKNTLKKVSALLLAGVLVVAASTTTYASSVISPGDGTEEGGTTITSPGDGTEDGSGGSSSGGSSSGGSSSGGSSSGGSVNNGSNINGYYPNGSFICGTSANGCGSAPVVVVDSATFGKSVAAAVKGDTVTATVKNGEVVSASVWQAAKDNASRVVINTGGTTMWIFGGITNAVDFNPTVYLSWALPKASEEAINAAVAKANIPANVAYTPISFAHHGNLPGVAEVTIDLSSTGKFSGGQTVYLYYLNPATGSFEYVDSSPCYCSATFTMTHCSDYIVTSEKLAGTSLRTSAKTDEASNIVVYSIILLAGASLVAVSSKKRALR